MATVLSFDDADHRSSWSGSTARPEDDLFPHALRATAPMNGNGKAAHIDDAITRRRWRLASELISDPSILAEPESVIPYMAWRQRLSLLVGREKTAGKTTYAGTAAAKKSCGGVHCGSRLQPGRVLWTIAEGHPSDVLRLMHAAGGDLDAIAIHNDLGEHRLATLEAQILDFKPDVTFVDTLAGFSSDRIVDASTSAMWVTIMETLGKMAQRGNTAIVVIAHARKSDGTARDSTAITAGVDMVLEMGAIADAPSARRIKAIGRWPIVDHTVALDNGEYRLVVNGEVSVEMKVLDFVRANPNASKSRIRDAVGGKAATVDKAIVELCERGLMMNDPGKSGNQYRLPMFGSNQAGTGLGTGALENAKSLQDMAGQASGQPHPVPDPNPSIGSGDSLGQERLL